MLIGMYSTYERNFDGSRMLDIVPPFVAALRDLVEAAKGVEIEPLHVPSTVDRSDMLIHVPNDKVPEEEMQADQSEQRGVRQKGASRSNAFSDNENPDTVWRKRRRGGSMGPEYPDTKRKMVDHGP